MSFFQDLINEPAAQYSLMVFMLLQKCDQNMLQKT
uniref:Uncharacterized protein n=1 Tax=viral metagenome TaxID=1070528 RepID=A0A6C0JM21_9ZZZZ